MHLGTINATSKIKPKVTLLCSFWFLLYALLESSSKFSLISLHPLWLTVAGCTDCPGTFTENCPFFVKCCLSIWRDGPPGTWGAGQTFTLFQGHEYSHKLCRSTFSRVGIFSIWQSMQAPNWIKYDLKLRFKKQNIISPWFARRFLVHVFRC